MIRAKRLFAAALVLGMSLPALAVTDDESGAAATQQPALGINETFGRWTGNISLVYDPDNAPELFADSNAFLALLQEAAAEWELVCGIRINVIGVDGNASADKNLSDPDDRDGLVRVFWGGANGNAGLGGPAFGSYDDDLGYFPYYDGSVELNNDPAVADDADELVSTLVHELGHVLGLGHSDNPASVMYANPYNNLRHPRLDDILAVQALYGPPAVPIDGAAMQPVWRYSVPADADESERRYLFQANQFIDTGLFVSVDAGSRGERVSAIDDSVSDVDFIFLNYGGIGNFDSQNDIEFDGRLVIVDPTGYVYRDAEVSVSCQSRRACSGGGVGFIQGQAIKTVPGDWRFFIEGVSAETGELATFASLTLPVDTSPTFNQAPIAAVDVNADGNEVEVTLAVQDGDNSGLTVAWHPPGPPRDADGDRFIDNGIIDEVANGDVISRLFNLPGSGQFSLFIEIADDDSRDTTLLAGFSTFGRGFQTLVRIDIDLPVQSDDDIKVSSNMTSRTLSRDAVLSSIASRNRLSGVTTHTGGRSSALLSASASANGGATSGGAFAAGDNIILAGEIVPATGDTGKAADILVLINDNNNAWSYRDTDGLFRPWNGKVSGLGAAYEIDSLSGAESFEIYRGILGTGNHRVFIGYLLRDGGGPIHFNSRALKLEVR